MDQPTTQQPTPDDRLLAEQILGSDIDHTWTGNWHQTLQETAALWANTPQHDLAA